MIQDKDYVAATCIGEARGEPIASIVGVAFVQIHRAYSARKLFKDIALAPNQFSCWNANDPNFGVLQKFLSDLENGNTVIDPYLRQCIVVGNAVVNGDFVDNVFGAKNYVSVGRLGLAKARRAQQDEWIIKMKVKVIHGNHVFLA